MWVELPGNGLPLLCTASWEGHWWHPLRPEWHGHLRVWAVQGKCPRTVAPGVGAQAVWVLAARPWSATSPNPWTLNMSSGRSGRRRAAWSALCFWSFGVTMPHSGISVIKWFMFTLHASGGTLTYALWVWNFFLPSGGYGKATAGSVQKGLASWKWHFKGMVYFILPPTRWGRLPSESCLVPFTAEVVL